MNIKLILLLAAIIKELACAKELKVIITDDSQLLQKATEALQQSCCYWQPSSNTSMDTVICATLTSGFDYINQETTSKSEEKLAVKLDISSSTAVNSVLILNEIIIISDLASLHISSANGAATIKGNCTRRKEKCEVGFVFSNIRTLTIENVYFHNFGQLSSCASCGIPFCNHSAIIFENIETVKITNINISDCVGGGMCVFNVTKSFSLTSSTISNNWSSKQQKPAGGLWISLGSAISTQYVINECTFENNSAITSHHYVHGGGLLFKVNDKSNAVVVIKNSTFNNNSAAHGGGMAVRVHELHSSNDSSLIVVMSGCTFRGNRAERSLISNGGGLQILLYSLDNVSIHVIDTNFTSNEAFLGGGTSLAAKYEGGKNRKLAFTNCYWNENKASVGAAIDARRTFRDKNPAAVVLYLIPVFERCTFISNTVEFWNHKHKSYLKESIGHGVFSVTLMDISFNKSVRFSNNTGSALTVANAVTTFNCSEGAYFINNTGINGGAISLEAISRLEINKGTQLFFIQNEAYLHGGAIYFHIPSDYMLLIPHACPFPFLKHKHNRPLIYFRNNKAQVSGNDTYLTSLIPCVLDVYPKKEINNFDKEILKKAEQILNNGAFEFNAKDIATAPSDFALPEKFLVTPGAKVPLDISLTDNLNQTVNQQVFFQSFKHCNNTVNQIDTINCISNDKALLTGQRNHTWQLRLQTLNKPILHIVMKVQMEECCPPGYTYNSTSEKCECIEVKLSKYLHFKNCSSDGKFAAYIQPKTWIGYMNGDINKEPVIVTALCYWFCNYNYTKPIPQYKRDNYSLILSDYVCKKYHEGITCSNCKKGYTAAYNKEHSCIKNKKCKYGWMWLIIADLLPLTIMILAVMIFKINVASGYIQGFLLYSHILDSLDILSRSRHKEVLNSVIKFTEYAFYYTLNLQVYRNFPSFCLFKGATAIDNTAMVYVSIVYSLFLIFTVVVFMRCFNIRFRNINRVVRFTTVKSSAVHGLLALFLLSYTRCMDTALLILQPVVLYKLNSNSQRAQVHSYRSFLHGEYHYFRKDHLIYAIPALVNLTITLIPSIMLFVYPLAVKVQIRYSIELRYPKTSYVLSKVFMYSTFKPFYDLFYSSFQDNYRFFAGLYLFYRILVSLTYYFPQEVDSLIMKEVLLVLFLGIHAIAQPYALRFHNIIDSLLLLDLVMINGFSTLLKIGRKGDFDINKTKEMCGIVVQMIGIVLPCVIVISHFFYQYIFKKCWRFVRGRYGYEELSETNSLMHHRSMGKSADFTKYEHT